MPAPPVSRSDASPIPPLGSFTACVAKPDAAVASLTNFVPPVTRADNHNVPPKDGAFPQHVADALIKAKVVGTWPQSSSDNGVIEALILQWLRAQSRG